MGSVNDSVITGDVHLHDLLHSNHACIRASMLTQNTFKGSYRFKNFSELSRSNKAIQTVSLSKTWAIVSQHPFTPISWQAAEKYLRIVSTPSAEATTVGTEAPTARMAPVPGGRIASKLSMPIMPMLLTVNVPELYSSGDSCLPRARFTKSCTYSGIQLALMLHLKLNHAGRTHTLGYCNMQL